MRTRSPEAVSERTRCGGTPMRFHRLAAITRFLRTASGISRRVTVPSSLKLAETSTFYQFHSFFRLSIDFGHFHDRFVGYMSQKLIESRWWRRNGRNFSLGGGAAKAGVPGVAGRVLEVAARAACLGVARQDEAVGEGDRSGQAGQAARAGRVWSCHGPRGRRRPFLGPRRGASRRRRGPWRSPAPQGRAGAGTTRRCRARRSPAAHRTGAGE